MAASQRPSRGGSVTTSIVSFMALAALLNPTIKGHCMEGSRIDKIDVKSEHKELIALYYRIELKTFVQVLLYERLSIKTQ